MPTKPDERRTERKLINEITPQSRIGDIIDKHPETAAVFLRLGIHCIGCHAAAFETIEEGCFIHGVNPEELVSEIREMIKNSNNKSNDDNI